MLAVHADVPSHSGMWYVDCVWVTVLSFEFLMCLYLIQGKVAD